jgi:hypothetical protein
MVYNTASRSRRRNCAFQTLKAVIGLIYDIIEAVTEGRSSAFQTRDATGPAGKNKPRFWRRGISRIRHHFVGLRLT